MLCREARWGFYNKAWDKAGLGHGKVKVQGGLTSEEDLQTLSPGILGVPGMQSQMTGNRRAGGMRSLRRNAVKYSSPKCQA